MSNHEDENGTVEPTISEAAELEMEDRELNILNALYQKGPALPIELAVRVLSFPEEIAEPLARLEQRGLVERQAMKTGQMIVLTHRGQEAIRGGRLVEL